MARFYGEMYGSARTPTSRIGNTVSGLTAHIRGWDIGVFVECRVNRHGRDVIEVYRTNGSNDNSRGERLAVIQDAPPSTMETDGQQSLLDMEDNT